MAKTDGNPWNQTQWFRNSLLLPLWFLNAWVLLQILGYLQPFLTLFTLALVLAIILDLPRGRLERWGLSKGQSLLVILLVAVVLGGGVIALLLPLLASQLKKLINDMPTWIDSTQGLLSRLLELDWIQDTSINPDNLMTLVSQHLTAAAETLIGSLPGLLDAGMSAGLGLFITIILTVFLLLGGPAAWNGVTEWLPVWWRIRIRSGLPKRLQQFIHGQLILAVGFSVTLAVVFGLIGVPFALLFGFLIGLFSLLPFMGAIAQLSVSLFLMLHDFSMGITVFVVAFVLGQILDNIIVPRVMGSLVGLNPLWLLLTLFLGAKIAGLPGILVAIPVASMVQALGDDWRSSNPSADTPRSAGSQA